MYIVHKKPLTEVLTEVSQAGTPEQRSAILKQYDCQALRMILRYVLDPRALFGIIKVPSYKLSQMPEGHHPSNLWIESRRLYIFLAGSTVPMKRQLAILTQILETMDPSESQLYEDIIMGNFVEHYPNVTAGLINEALPGCLSKTLEAAPLSVSP